MIRIFDDMTQCTPAEVARMLPRVSSQRRAQALRYKHVFGQFACLKSYLLLQQLLYDAYGITGDLAFAYNAYGKPALLSSPISFSISHCKRAIAVAVSEYPIGLDIETLRHPSSSLIEKTMNAAECQQIAQSPNPDAAFTALWTQKEAVLKWRGTGIVDNLYTVLNHKENVFLHTTEVLDKGYIYSVCVEKSH